MNPSKPKWIGLALNGTVAIIIGLIFIFMPHQFITSIIKIIGLILAVSGAVMLFFSFFRNKSKGALNIYYIAQGIINLAIGIIMFVNPVLMIDFLLFVIGLWALAIGVFQVIYALRVRKVINSGFFLLANGLMFIAIGLIMVIEPEFIITAMLAITGGIVGFLGLIILFFSFLVYQHNKTTVYEDVSNQNILS